jgi:hypothetical protein
MLSVIFKTKTSAIFSTHTKDTRSLGAPWFMGSEFRRVDSLVKPVGTQQFFQREAIIWNELRVWAGAEKKCFFWFCKVILHRDFESLC